MMDTRQARRPALHCSTMNKLMRRLDHPVVLLVALGLLGITGYNTLAYLGLRCFGAARCSA